MHFISFGYTKGAMYSFTDEVFMVHKKRHGNSRIYGALFVLDDYEFYIRQIDAMHACRKSLLRRNHVLDTYHRKEVNVVPIKFDTLEEFAVMKYKELAIIEADTYLGNLEHPKISQRVQKRYRVMDGLDIKHYTRLHREVIK